MICISLQGCSTCPPNLVKQGLLEEEILSKDKIKISSLHIYEEEDSTIIKGNIRRKWGYRVPVWGHVDIAWYSPQNKLLGQQGTTYLPQRLSSLGTSSKFKMVIPEKLVVGSIVRASYHNSRLNNWPLGDCPNNKAMTLQDDE